MKKQAVVLVLVSIIILALIGFAFLLSAYIRPTPRVVTPADKGTSLLIPQGAVGSYKDLRIGVTDIGSEYASESSVKRTQVDYALLQISYLGPEKERKEQSFKVRVGQKIDVGVYAVAIQGIELNSWLVRVLSSVMGSTGQAKGQVLLNVDSLWACDKINFPNLCP